MSRYVEFEYYESDQKFFLNKESVSNFQPWKDGSTMISMMPHFEPFPDYENPHIAPFVCFVKGTMEEVAAKLNG